MLDGVVVVRARVCRVGESIWRLGCAWLLGCFLFNCVEVWAVKYEEHSSRGESSEVIK